VAVGLVVLHHSVSKPLGDALTRHHLTALARLISSTTAGGVELFFVLSGVLLLSPLITPQTERRAFAPGRYVRRRVERLWPPYLLALAFGAAVIAFTSAHPTWYSREVLPAFSWGATFRQLGLVNLGWTSYNGAWWSLTIEVVFYAVLAGAGIVIARRAVLLPTWARRITIVVVFAVAFVAFKAHFNGADVASGDTFTVFLMYLPCFAIGGLTGALVAGVRSATLRAMVVAGAAVVLLSTVATSVSPIIGFALVDGALVVALGRGRLRTVARILRAPLVVWLGERSYSMFLVHFSVLYVILHAASFHFASRTGAYFVTTRVAAVPAILLVTIAVFEVAEKPFARGLATAGARWPWQARVSDVAPIPTA